MHPVIAQAIVEDRARELRAHAAAARLGRQFRRSQLARRTRLFSSVVRARRDPAAVPAPRPLRGPRAA